MIGHYKGCAMTHNLSANNCAKGGNAITAYNL